MTHDQNPERLPAGQPPSGPEQPWAQQPGSQHQGPYPPPPYGQQPYPPPGYLPPGHHGPRQSWPRRHKVLTALGSGIGLLVVIGVAGLTAGGNHQAPAAPAAPAAARSTAAPAAAAPDTPSPADTSAAAQAGPEMLSPGQAETVGDASTDVTEAAITVRSATVTTQPAQPYGSAPASGYFVVVHVSATADPAYTDGFDINELDFYALDGGNHYVPGNGNAYGALTDGQSNADLTATLAAGETSSGWMAFDVPRRHGEIVYAPNRDGQPLAEWKY